MRKERVVNLRLAIIVTPFDNYSYDVRVKFIERIFKHRGYNTLIISANFDHRLKQDYKSHREGLELINVPKYKKNLSFMRIWSHRIFAKECVKKVDTLKPDILYVSGPPNFLYFYFSKFKNKNKNTKLIYEIGDMWPETLPFEHKKKLLLALPLNIWSQLRNKNLYNSDYIIFQCNLFRNLIKNEVEILKEKTIYMCKEANEQSMYIEQLSIESLNIIYLGSINNIIDIDFITEITKRMLKTKSICIHIVGDGENREYLLKELLNIGAEVKYHGVLYKEYDKWKVFKKCHFAFNIMKKSVCVGVTMKSIDYLEANIPLINNILYDTADIINKYNCGYNVNFDNMEAVADQITKMDMEQIYQMKKNTKQVYEKYFSVQSFNTAFNEVLDEVIDD